MLQTRNTYVKTPVLSTRTPARGGPINSVTLSIIDSRPSADGNRLISTVSIRTVNISDPTTLIVIPYVSTYIKSTGKLALMQQILLLSPFKSRAMENM